MVTGTEGMGFALNTRQKRATLQNLVKPVGGGITTQELPKSGLLARIMLSIRITTAGTITTQAPEGAAKAIKRVRLTTNSGIDIFNVSGVGNHYLLQNFLEMEGMNGRQPKNQGNSTLVTATTYNLDMVIPVQVNMHDPTGFILTQSEQLQLILTVEWAADVEVILTGGGTYTGTCTPYMEYFTVPTDPRDMPRLNTIHQIIEDQISVPAGANYIYNFPRGNVYLQALFGYGVDATATDDWSQMIVRVNQNDILYDLTPALADMLIGYVNGQTRGLGQIPLDLLGSDGLGSYGSSRDFINSGALTDFQAVLTPTGANTLYVVRRMLVPFNG